VLLLRDGAHGVEVLLTRRHQNLAFMGGVWVFPGGTLSAADSSAQSLQRIPPDARISCSRFTDLQGRPLPENHCIGLAVAAYRETFEEAGILLATTAQGAPCDPTRLTELQVQRRAVVAQPERFAALLHREALFLEIDRLSYWAHWITPAGSPRRFDTRFFAMALPPGQIAMIDDVEAVEQVWMRPAALAKAAAEGAMTLAPPTLYTAAELAAALQEHDSLDAALSARADRPIPPLLPKLVPGTTTVVLPWDPEYAALPGEGTPADAVIADILRRLPSRVALLGR